MSTSSGNNIMSNTENFLPLHGGDIVAASERYGIGIEEWVDLSTGVNPEPYPVDKIPLEAFYQLPYLRPEFYRAARAYYQAAHLLPVTGTQVAIQVLPKLLSNLPILIPEVGYQEHLKHWRKAGAATHFYPSFERAETLCAIDQSLQSNNRQHLLIINPNNPTGLVMEQEQILRWSQKLADGAYLIIDEAFMDIIPETSLLTQALPDNVIILRSFGKFFGLAGVRLGFVFANPLLLKSFANTLGIWQVNGPAQHLAIQALEDKAWQQRARIKIADAARCTQQLFKGLIQQQSVHKIIHTDLFSSYIMPQYQAVHISEYFAQAGILLRVIPLKNHQAIVRVGILSTTNTQALTYAQQVVNSYGKQSPQVLDAL